MYKHAEAGTLDDAPSIPTFQDYIAFERQTRLEGNREDVSDFWAEKQTDTLPVPRLYGHHGAVSSSRSDRISIDLGQARSDRLRALTMEPDLRSWTQHLSLFNIFSTVLFAYLNRVSGERKLSIGTPAHNRPTPVFKQTPGVFIELFPLLAEIEDGDGFDTLLQRVRTEINGFLRYAQPGATSPELNRQFHVVLNYIHAEFSDFNGIPMQSDWVHPDHCDPRHHLRLQVYDFDASGSIQLHFDLNTEVFATDKHASVPQHFLTLLDAFIEDRTQPISQPGLITKNEYDRTVIQFNPVGTHDNVSPNDNVSRNNAPSNILTMFESQVAKSPNAPALNYQDTTISYQTLNEKANQLAHYLLQKGIGPGKRVAIYMKRSPELMISILGVMKSGAAYVPVAANYPGERVSYMLTDAEAAMLLTQKKLGLTASVPTLFMDSASAEVTAQPTTNPDTTPDAGTLAYLMYTSGSTGQPKGVMISHGALANYIGWAKDIYAGDAVPVMPLFTMIGFDLTVTSLFVPLVSGGTIAIYEETLSGPDLALLDVVRDNKVNIMKLTPSHLALLQDKNLSGSNLQTLIVGGEDFKAQLAASVYGVLGKEVHIYNEYGPTEATVGCVVHKFEKRDTQYVSVPIGKPVQNMQAYVLDEYLHPVPQGVVGELYISGTGLAEGYWNQPELTASKFVANPFRPDTLMYRTGDQVRFNDQGILEYLGRIDHQVKIGGIRIELGEIEAALASHPSVKESVVDLREKKGFAGAEHVTNCTQCGLPSNYPNVVFDEAGVCNLCCTFESYQTKAKQYFRKMPELEAIFERSKKHNKGEYDCLMLLSGGKDSTYALGRLIEMGLKVLTFTLDNGYISEQAKANIRRVVNGLGVDHVFGETSAMNAIFVDSLNRHCNVCNGCFKTIYTLSTKLAAEKGIPIIITGLSRGQFFETRLTEELFWNENVDFNAIDETILNARKAYHRVDDAVNQLLDVSIFENDAVFEKVQFVDFYRYCDVSLEEMMEYLETRLPWTRPTDTGRSTNCLINQVGIYVHKKERGYSNYAFPYSWDVRMGHKTRDASLDEINEEIDEKEVKQIMREIGYTPPGDDGKTEKHLVAYYTSDMAISPAELRKHLAEHLPDYMLPAHLVKLDDMPLTSNGKVDRKALPGWDEERPELEVEYAAPETEIEEMLAEMWEEVLQLEQVGIHDNFLQLGGTSLAAIRLMARINEAFELELPLNRIFEHPTVEILAAHIEETIETLLAEMEAE